MGVFLPAGDVSCLGAAAAPSTSGTKLTNGQVTVNLERAARYKLCVSTMAEPFLDEHFTYSTGVMLSVEACSPPPPPTPSSPPLDVRISPTTIQAARPTTLTVEGVIDDAWLVFLLAGDVSCLGAAAARVPNGAKLTNGQVTVNLLWSAALYKLCVSSVDNPWLDDQFDIATGVTLTVNETPKWLREALDEQRH